MSDTIPTNVLYLLTQIEKGESGDETTDRAKSEEKMRIRNDGLNDAWMVDAAGQSKRRKKIFQIFTSQISPNLICTIKSSGFIPYVHYFNLINPKNTISPSMLSQCFSLFRCHIKKLIIFRLRIF
jgi:hypothetical protein